MTTLNEEDLKLVSEGFALSLQMCVCVAFRLWHWAKSKELSFNALLSYNYLL